MINIYIKRQYTIKLQSKPKLEQISTTLRFTHESAIQQSIHTYINIIKLKKKNQSEPQHISQQTATASNKAPNFHQEQPHSQHPNPHEQKQIAIQQLKLQNLTKRNPCTKIEP